MTRTPSEAIPLPIIGSGLGWLVAEKPSGMSIHNDPGIDLCSLLNNYFQSNPSAAKSIAYDVPYGLNPVHRLDKETSGVILLSCRRDVFDYLSQQFVQGKVTKRYLALVHGSVAATVDWGLWQWPLTPKAGGRRNPQGQGRRSPCQTQYRLLEQSDHYSLIECRLITGRTHQIRRHAVLAGHPLVGDPRYGSLRACRYLEKHHQFMRLGLHAAALTIQPPDGASPQRFTSERLPVEMERLLHHDRPVG
jgi:RluA family pseudouridine synthase